MVGVVAVSIEKCELLSQLQSWEFKGEDGICVRGDSLHRNKEVVIHFLAGTAFACRIYWPFLKPFAEKYDFFWHDYKGHGDSDNGDGEFDCWKTSTERASFLLHRHLTQLENQSPSPHGKPKIIGMGHSYGGAMTTIMAAQKVACFDALLLIDPFMVPENLESNYRQMVEMLVAKSRERDPLWHSEQQVRDYMASKFMFQDWHEDAIQAFIAFNLDRLPDGGFTLKCPPTIEAGVYDDKVTALWPSVEKLQVPTVILSGNKTVPFFAEGHRRAAELNPNIRLVSVQGGHNFMQELPAENVEIAMSELQALLR